MRSIIMLIIILLFGCTSSPPYAWQDKRQPAREYATDDLEACRSYAARQYRPGIPAGDPYLALPEAEGLFEDSDSREWRPDRSPFPIRNVNELPLHEIPVDYTGYPGELDYYPGYLDAILEKCMNDRGWKYGAVPGDQ